MKFFKLLFIILASSTYRCSDQETVDCEKVAAELIGEWRGSSIYSNPRSANGSLHEFSLVVSNSDGCNFMGVATYESSITTFNVTGSVDIFGWVTFTEESKLEDGGEYNECLTRTNSNAICNSWPDLRWKEGNKFEDARFKRNPYILNGKFQRPNSFERTWQKLRGTFSLSKI